MHMDITLPFYDKLCIYFILNLSPNFRCSNLFYFRHEIQAATRPTQMHTQEAQAKQETTNTFYHTAT